MNLRLKSIVIGARLVVVQLNSTSRRHAHQVRARMWSAQAQCLMSCDRLDS